MLDDDDDDDEDDDEDDDDRGATGSKAPKQGALAAPVQDINPKGIYHIGNSKTSWVVSSCHNNAFIGT